MTVKTTLYFVICDSKLFLSTCALSLRGNPAWGTEHQATIYLRIGSKRMCPEDKGNEHQCLKLKSMGISVKLNKLRITLILRHNYCLSKFLN